MVNARAIAGVAAVACIACATVAGVEVTRAPPGSDERVDVDDAASARLDGGDEPAPVPAGDGGPGGDGAGDARTPEACGCDAANACCVTSATTAACVGAGSGCPGERSLLLACARGDSDGRDCCWNATGPLRSTSRSSTCEPARTACLTDDDCVAAGGRCTTVDCGVVVIGACGSAALECPP